MVIFIHSGQAGEHLIEPEVMQQLNRVSQNPSGS
jgi:hypothetical protein